MTICQMTRSISRKVRGENSIRWFPQGQKCIASAYKALNIKYKTVFFLSLFLFLSSTLSLSLSRSHAAKMWSGNCAYWAKLGLTLDDPHKYPTLAACYFAPRESQADHNARYFLALQTLYQLITAVFDSSFFLIFFFNSEKFVNASACAEGYIIILLYLFRYNNFLECYPEVHESKFLDRKNEGFISP